MLAKTALAAGSLLLLGACASNPSQAGFSGERTVFHNPYADPVIANGPIGLEQCGVFAGQAGCWLDGLFYPGAGGYAFDRAGNRVSLSKRERRAFRERSRLIAEQVELNELVADFNERQASLPPPPVPTAPPIATPAAGSNSERGRTQQRANPR